MRRRSLLTALPATAVAAAAGDAVATPLESESSKALWKQLEPFVQVYGPDDDVKRPAALLFHGCGGMRPHLKRFGEAAAEAGWRAFVVDSYAPRGWSRQFGMAFVCTGMRFHGAARAPDVAATIVGVSARPDVDKTRLALGGWSHGGWSIMELMCDPPADLDLSGVKACFLNYPYVGPGAVRRTAPWKHRPRTLAVIARRDHLTTLRNAEKVHSAIRASGVPLDSWTVDATHSYDEGVGFPPMRHDPAATTEALARFKAFLEAEPGA